MPKKQTKRKKDKEIHIDIRFPLTPKAIKKLQKYFRQLNWAAEDKCVYCGGELERMTLNKSRCTKCGKNQL